MTVLDNVSNALMFLLMMIDRSFKQLETQSYINALNMKCNASIFLAIKKLSSSEFFFQISRRVLVREASAGK